MNKEKAVDIVWDYMHMHHPLKQADCIFILGSIDTRVANHAASLYHAGYAPTIAISGDGTKHETTLLSNQYKGQTEATVLTQVCKDAGVPESAIVIEDKANNTGQNFEFITPVLKNAGISLDTIIAVQKPYMERRTYATGKIWWPDIELIVSSPQGTFSEYVADAFDPDVVINIMLGDLQRIKEYPALGYQIHQDIPAAVLDAFTYLTGLGYTKHLLKA
jgi:uncharacterized SAM-binding protein YcdF (DUF218 family)